MITVWIYVDTTYRTGHPYHLKVFANPVAADKWFKSEFCSPAARPPAAILPLTKMVASLLAGAVL